MACNNTICNSSEIVYGSFWSFQQGLEECDIIGYLVDDLYMHNFASVKGCVILDLVEDNIFMVNGYGYFGSNQFTFYYTFMYVFIIPQI